MSFVVENVRLRELAAIAEQNRGVFDYLVEFLTRSGYSSLHEFVLDENDALAEETILNFLRTPFPSHIALYDGIARPYPQQKAKWLLLGWVFRDAPEQRLRPMLPSIQANTKAERQAIILNRLRSTVREIFPDAARWSWIAISEVMIDRLEGSRRAIKGTLFEAIVRRSLSKIFQLHDVPLNVSDAEIMLSGETYDVSVIGDSGQILLPVKTRETMGGGHANLFTRDIHKSVSLAHDAGYVCLPIIIAESWSGNLNSLDCEDYIYIDRNPNQVTEVERILEIELGNRLIMFQSIM